MSGARRSSAWATAVLVEPSNAALVQALEEAGLLAPSTVLAFEHGQNVGDLERLLRLVGAGLAIAATTRHALLPCACRSASSPPASP